MNGPLLIEQKKEIKVKNKCQLMLKKVSVTAKYDVLVAGGGPSGCAAAISAARNGAKVLLVEGTGALGGMGTSGLLPAWCPFSDGEKMIYRGIAEEVFLRSREGMQHINKNNIDWQPIDTEKLKAVYDDLTQNAGVKVLFHSMLCDVIRKGRRVKYAVIANKAGLQAIEAKVFVDCTGDADLSAFAGAKYEKGDDNGEMQPVTHCFMLSNVDTYSYLYGSRPVRALIPLNEALKKYPKVTDFFMCNSLVGPGTVIFNTGHQWNIDGTNPDDVTKALIEGRKIAVEFLNMFKEYFPKAFANAFLAATAPLLGVRETRRIVGDYVLTVSDYLARKSFPDEIGRNSYPIDIHTAKNEIKKSLENKVSAMERFENYKAGESHGIPYRSLIPKDLDNVLVAGRSISTDRPVQASVRVMPPCLVTGQAAGLAAALAVAKKGDVRSIDVAKLRNKLRKDGAYLP